MSVAEETASLIELLPPGKAQSVLDFARYLADQEEEQAWERSLARAQHSQKFRDLVDEVEQEIAEGKDQPMDLDRL